MDQEKQRAAVRSRNNPILVVDSYARGISIGRVGDTGAGFDLQVDGDRVEGAGLLRSRYVMQSGEPLGDLERHLTRLSSRGELRRTTVVFGVTTDPFHPFDEKFATSMKFLEMFERYSPGKLIIQTRSPLVVIGLPILKKVKNTTFVSIGIETPSDEVRQRYTPQLPSVSERWKTVRALKRFGLRVGIQVAPLLPYGDWRNDAQAFAEDLAAEAEWISVTSIAQAAGSARPSGVLARKLAADRQFFWLRADTQKPLSDALHRIAPEKVFHPATVELPDPQMMLFGSSHL
jgi:hypothetical protein